MPREMNDHLKMLNDFRNELVQRRRLNARDNNMAGTITAQEHLEVIDRAIEEEKRLAKSEARAARPKSPTTVPRIRRLNIRSNS